jgi:hypothetical protein
MTPTRTHRPTPLRALTLTAALLGCLVFGSAAAAAAGLPDGRVYEKVSPSENENSEVYVPFAITGTVLGFGQGVHTSEHFGSSVDGSTVEYVGDPVAGGNGTEGGAGGGEGFVATRLLGGGWALAQKPALAPLFSLVPPNRGAGEFDDEVVSELAGRVFFSANDALTADAVDGGAGENNLYVSVDGRLSLVNVLPGGGTVPGATFGAPPFGEPVGNGPTRNPADFGGAVSSDGSRVFWTLLEGAVTPKGLFVDLGVGGVGERTLQVDASQAGGPGGGGRFWSASSDGSKVFFTDSDMAGLTASTVPGSGVNL